MHQFISLVRPARQIIKPTFLKGKWFATFQMKVPTMGESITEGTIADWKKQVGEYVKADEVICVLDTDKVSIDVHASTSGKVIAHAAEKGGTVYVSGDLVTIETSADDAAPAAAKSSDSQPAQAQAPPTPTPAEGTHGGSKYVAKISFPNRKAGDGHAHQAQKKQVSSSPPAAAAPVPPKPAAPTKTTKGREVTERFENWSDLPAKYKPRGLSEEEIEAINTGGSYAEKWVSKTSRVYGK